MGYYVEIDDNANEPCGRAVERGPFATEAEAREAAPTTAGACAEDVPHTARGEWCVSVIAEDGSGDRRTVAVWIVGI